MEEDPPCQLRRRRSAGNPNLPLNLEVGFQVNEGGPNEGTPTPSQGPIKLVSSDRDSSAAMREFRKKQQSFDVQEIHIEECEEEEIIVDSDDEGDGEDEARGGDRAITPTPRQDVGGSVTYTEGPKTMDFLKVRTLETECITDVSDADDDEDE